MELSISSLRADSLTEDLVASALARGGPSHADHCARGRDRAPAPRDPQGRSATSRSWTACDLVRAQGIPNLKTLLHDRPADRDHRGRRGHRRSRRGGCSSGCGCSDAKGHPFGRADAVDLVVRAEAVDAVSVGAVRRRRVARAASWRSSSGACGALQRARAAREPPRGRVAGAARARRPSGRRLHRAWRPPRRRLAAGAARVGRRSRVLHHARRAPRRAHAVGPLRGRREEGRSAPRVGARGRRRAPPPWGWPDGRAARTSSAARSATCGSRSPTGATCAARTACRRRSTSGCRATRSSTSRRSSRLVDVFIELGVDKVRLTGGEPLLRRDLPRAVRLLAAKPRLRDLAMTTNGVLLAEQAPALQRGRAPPGHGEPRHAAARTGSRALTRRDDARPGAGGHRRRAARPASPGSRSTPWSCAASTTTSWST